MHRLPPCLSRAIFGSFLVYSPRGKSEVSGRSRDIVYRLKAAKEGLISYAVGRLLEEMAGVGSATALHEVLGEDVLVVPCPRSAPLVKGALWPAKEICDELLRRGLARQISPILERISAVHKSSTSAPGARPKPMEHIRSMRVAAETDFVLPRITIVDDVITKGATLLAAASHIKHEFPDSEVRLFAMVRTGGGEVERIVDPVVGEVSLHGADSVRRP